MTNFYSILHPGTARRALIALLLLAGGSRLDAQTVAVAANAQALVGELATAYRAHSGIAIRTVVAASGVLTTQIKNGAPFDLFLSADTGYPARLWREGIADTPRVYAYGKLVLWTRSGVDLSRGLRALASPSVRSIAVANPRNAPYGAAALEALRSGGLFESVEAKLVFGESIAQVNQYIDTRTADVGITSSSAVVGRTGEWRAVDTALYAAIPQAAAVVRRPTPEAERPARAFLAFLFTPAAQAVFQRYGYALP